MKYTGNSWQASLHMLTEMLRAEYLHHEAQLIAWELIRFVTQKSRIELIVSQSVLTNEQMADALVFVKKHLVQKVPIAYITGELLFGDLTLSIRPPVLIPRTETEAWCYELIERLEPHVHKPLRILDLCTGSGCIALALAHALPQATVLGTDINQEALLLAEKNKEKVGLANCSFKYSNLFSALADERFDIIVANPPYIGMHEKSSLSESVLNFESPQALFAEKEGYAIIESIISQAPSFLRYNETLTHHNIPQLLIEIGYTQAERVKAFMQEHNYANITMWKDYQGHNRVACAQVSPYGFQHKSAA